MNRVKDFYKKHDKVLCFIGGGVTIVALGLLGIKVRNTIRYKNQIRIDPDYYPTLDEAVEAFKILEKTTDWAVICSGGNGYGVFDEASVIKNK